MQKKRSSSKVHKRTSMCYLVKWLHIPKGWSRQLMHPEGMGVRLVQVSVATSEWLHHQTPTVIHHAGPASEESQPQEGAEPSNISLNKVTTSRFVPMINLVTNRSTSLYFSSSILWIWASIMEVQEKHGF